MRVLQAKLIFKGQPRLALGDFAAGLPMRIGRFAHSFTKTLGSTSKELCFKAHDMELTVKAVDEPLCADEAADALGGSLARSKRPELTDILASQCCYMSVTLTVEEDGHRDWEQIHALFHTVTVFLAEWHVPAAVHWGPSNQLITGNTYLRLANRPMPWPLWLQAVPLSEQAGSKQFEMKGAISFLGVKLIVDDPEGTEDFASDLATAFIRHFTQNGSDKSEGLIVLDNQYHIDVVAEGLSDVLPGGQITLFCRRDIVSDMKPGPNESDQAEKLLNTEAAIGDMVSHSRQPQQKSTLKWLLPTGLTIIAMVISVAVLKVGLPQTEFSLSFGNAKIVDISTDGGYLEHDP